MHILKIHLAIILLLTIGFKPAIGNSLVEDPLKKSISAVVEQKSDKGIVQISELAERFPNFKLAQYIKADLLSYRSGQHFKKTESIISEEIYKELEARLKEDSVVKEGLYPSEILYMGQMYPHVLVADISKSRLYVYNNELTLVNSFYISIGRGGAGKEKQNDGKTPIGTYFIDKRIDGEILPDKYGDVAYTLNYPNAWDKMQGKTGYGIWLHGTTKDLYNRAPKATEGCIALANDDLKILGQYITENSPVIIGNPVQWSRKKAVFNNQEFIKTFNTLNKDVTQLVAQDKTPFNFSVVSNALALEVNPPLNNLSLINGPEKEMLIAAFLQQGADTKITRVEQYWKKNATGWTVVSDSRIDPNADVMKNQ